MEGAVKVPGMRMHRRHPRPRLLHEVTVTAIAHAYGHSSSLAMRAPSASAWNFAHTTVG